MDGRHEERALSVARHAQGGGGAQSAHNKRLYAAARRFPRLTALAVAASHVCVRRGRRRHLARVAPLGGPPRLRLLLRYDHVEAAERAARDDADRLLLPRRRGQVPARVEVPTARYRGVRDVHILRSAERAATHAVVRVFCSVPFFPQVLKCKNISIHAISARLVDNAQRR